MTDAAVAEMPPVVFDFWRLACHDWNERGPMNMGRHLRLNPADYEAAMDYFRHHDPPFGRPYGFTLETDLGTFTLQSDVLLRQGTVALLTDDEAEHSDNVEG